ncbi:MAG: helix-turn-helix transcriptional regulator [Lachnospiraceae bacterium]|nr:helix-turn-helix transcriptional regulator [Lachnospiraceae bacterium]MBR1460236.1 helix-turn-helix transcriptional regulator [bacterium]
MENLNIKNIECFIANLKFITKGYTQKGIVEKLENAGVYIHSSDISKWKKGQSLPDLNDLINISNYYGCSLDELLNTNFYEKIQNNQVDISVCQSCIYKTDAKGSCLNYRDLKPLNVLVGGRCSKYRNENIYSDFD